MKNDSNFKLREYVASITYDDFNNKTYYLKVEKGFNSIEKVKEHINNELHKLPNSDLDYHIEIIEVFEIINPNYLKFKEDIENLYNSEDLHFNYPTISGNKLEYNIPTPETSIPKKVVITKELMKDNNNYIDDNGRILYDKVKKHINLLEQLLKEK